MMNIILISRSATGSVRRSLHATHHFLLLALGGALILAAMAAAGYWAGRWHYANSYMVSWEQRLAEQQESLEAVRRNARAEVDALTARLADLQGRVTRIDALGRKLINVSNIDASEFDFGSRPGMGGPMGTTPGRSYEVEELSEAIESLDERLENRERQLVVLEDVLMERELNAATIPAGEPIGEGWMSSPYGNRQDPITGKRAWHDGVDFAGRMGSSVLAVAAGVVTYAGERWGYGKMVEVTHGSGYVTRYAHALEVTVEEGEVVRRGDQVAEMGSSGRSTGPHVHLEVLKNGESVNPWKYVQAER